MGVRGERNVRRLWVPLACSDIDLDLIDSIQDSRSVSFGSRLVPLVVSSDVR